MSQFLPIVVQLYVAEKDDAYYSLVVTPDADDASVYICVFKEHECASEFQITSDKLKNYIENLDKSFMFSNPKPVKLVVKVPGFPTMRVDLRNTEESKKLFTNIESQIKLLESMTVWPESE